MTEKSIDIKNELLIELENMYVAKVFDGRFTSTGSFFAKDDKQNEYFVTKEFANKKSELIKTLSEKINPLWVLVQDEIWGGKWGNKQVSKIFEISEIENDCFEFKNKMILQIQTRRSLRELNQQHFKLIEEHFGKPLFTEKEQALLHEKSLLQEKLVELNNQLDT